MIPHSHAYSCSQKQEDLNYNNKGKLFIGKRGRLIKNKSQAIASLKIKVRILNEICEINIY